MTTPKLQATFVTLFPDMITPVTQSSILGRAVKSGSLDIQTVQIRGYAIDKHHTVDDTPYGGGPGQLMRVDVVVNAIRSIQSENERPHVILMDPCGKKFTQQDAKRLSQHQHLVFVCGRYEGIDSRISHYVDETISIGDYILTGGELPALTVLDATARYVPGVLGNEESFASESMSESLLEYEQYTRPVVFEGLRVPEVLCNGNHAHIEAYRRKNQLERTQKLRPDLFAQHTLTEKDKKLLKE